MAGADFTRIDPVVVEIFTREGAGFVADQAVFRDLGGVPLDLDLHIVRDGEKRASQLIYKGFLRFGQRVDIGRRAVAVLRECLHRGVVEVASPEAQHRQIGRVAVLGDVGLEPVGV